MESKCILDTAGNKFWYNSKHVYHKENNLPAIEWSNGEKCYFVNGKYHREDGPAAVWLSGEHWCLNGIKYSPENMPLSLYLARLKWELKKHGK